VPISRSAKVLLQTPGTGSLVLCACGLALGATLIATWGHITPHPASTRTAALEPATLAPITPPAFKPLQLPAQPLKPRATSRPHHDRAIFRTPIDSGQLTVLTSYAGQPAKEALKQPGVRQVVNTLTPYAPFHFGADFPLPMVLEAVLHQSSVPVSVRNGRYMMFATVSGTGVRGARQAFVWIDLQQGIALGGIFFHPNNGEPTPTLTLFSRQVSSGSLRMSQLPVAFLQDLTVWAASAGIPAITTRYFINGSGEKLVLTHDEDYCKPAAGMPSSSQSVCRQMKAEAADLDLRAASFLGQTHYASNGTMHMISAQLPDSSLAR